MSLHPRSGMYCSTNGPSSGALIGGEQDGHLVGTGPHDPAVHTQVLPSPAPESEVGGDQDLLAEDGVNDDGPHGSRAAHLDGAARSLIDPSPTRLLRSVERKPLLLQRLAEIERFEPNSTRRELLRHNRLGCATMFRKLRQYSIARVELAADDKVDP